MTSREDRELLRHHGDVDAGDGLLDFAVNVRLQHPPRWLRDRLVAALDRLGSYPSAHDDLAARTAVATRHGRDAGEVLILSGAAECFALLPSLRPQLAAVVHPSFTEPELVLRTAGVPVTRVMLDAADGYRLRADAVPEQADLVVVGNPTNPTSVQHSADELRKLIRPWRVLVVDEAFMDAIPEEPESLGGDSGAGLLVVRSLTKMWALPGLRAGYALGDPALLARLAQHRPHWPVSTLVYEAVLACCGTGALAASRRAAAAFAAERVSLCDQLTAITGVQVHQPASAPFLLVRIDNGEVVRQRLRQRGIALRRGDTFPGLTMDHVRIAVRTPEYHDVLITALRAELDAARLVESTKTGGAK